MPYFVDFISCRYIPALILIFSAIGIDKGENYAPTSRMACNASHSAPMGWAQATHNHNSYEHIVAPDSIVASDPALPATEIEHSATFSPPTSDLSKFEIEKYDNRYNSIGRRIEKGVLDIDNLIYYRLYTRQMAEGSPLKTNNIDLLHTSSFSPSRPTKIIVHGAPDTPEIGDWMSVLRDAFLMSEDVNVIMVNYAPYEKFLFFWTNIPLLVSEKLADFIVFLEKNGASPDSIHIVARSWGTHLAGMSGRLLRGRIGRISGLEPAAPRSNFVEQKNRLDKTDAQFVDVVHINGQRFFFHGAQFGLMAPMGHVDIYPNIIERVVGCPNDAQFVPKGGMKEYSLKNCVHGRGVKYFIDSIRVPEAHEMCHCNSFYGYMSNDCACKENVHAFMGQNELGNGQKSKSTGLTGVYQLAVSPETTVEALKRAQDVRNPIVKLRRPVWG